ncbi:Syndetin, partial [Nibea albiflora]
VSLSAGLALFQEELRELREQPIDPQAEQEIIDSIEEVYFSNDSFDMVQHELEVSKKVADLILEKQPAYVKELERVTALQTNLQLAAVICTNARRQLSVAKEGFTEASLGLLANQRRRQLLTGLLKSLRTIKTLEEDYPGAIQLCLECQKAASTFKHYSCISELNSKLQDTLEQIEEQLDVALSKTCKHFDVSHYTKVQLAYTLLGKTQHITLDSYIPCLTDLCKALWEVMLSYHRTMQWHEEHDKQDATPTPDDAAASESDKSVVDRSYVKKKLEHGLTRIWQDVQLKVKAYILGTDMSNFKYDDFIVVLDVISRARLEELRMFLENETWELCPVKSNFNIAQLHEFKFMGQCRSPSVSPSRQAVSTTSPAQEELSLFQQYLQEGNPFEMHTEHKEEETEDVLASNGYESDELEKSVYQDYDSDSDVPEELKQDYVDEQTGDAPLKSVSRETIRSRKKSDYNLNKTNAPILTNTTLNVIRLVGKYMQMMNILKPIAFDVIHCVSQLFDYYLYAVYTFFGRNDMEAVGENAGVHGPAEDRKEKVPSPHLSQLVVLTNSGTLYGLAQRVVATESLVFLAEQFESLQSHLDTMMPAAKKPFLQQFYSQTVSTASELRKPIYWIVAAKAIDYEQMLLLMAGVKWDIREIMSQHNVYVDVLLKEFEQFNKRLGDVSRHVRIPLPVSNVLWEHCIRLANRTLVEGNEGRALMQLDFQQFLMKLEKLTDLRPIPDKEFVETYIKAYYLTENDMEQFIKNHREYSMKQLANLVNVCLGSHINKKARQKLLAAIDDIDRPKR